MSGYYCNTCKKQHEVGQVCSIPISPDNADLLGRVFKLEHDMETMKTLYGQISEKFLPKEVKQFSGHMTDAPNTLLNLLWDTAVVMEQTDDGVLMTFEKNQLIKAIEKYYQVVIQQAIIKGE